MCAFFALKFANNLYCVGNEFRRLNENFVHRSQPSGPLHPYGNPLNFAWEFDYDPFSCGALRDRAISPISDAF